MIPSAVPSIQAPAERSSLTDAEIAALQPVFGVGEWLSWRRTPKGTSNDSFFLATTTGPYVLRRSNTRKSVAATLEEIAFIRYLRTAGYPAPEIVSTQQGHGFVEHQGRIYLMTALIAGAEYDAANPRHLEATALGLARYHRLARAYTGSFGKTSSSQLRMMLQGGTTTAAAIRQLGAQLLAADEQAHLDDVLSRVGEQLAAVEQELGMVYPRLIRLLVQGSFGRSAVIFDGDRLVGVVDYDRCTTEIRALDLAYTIKALCRVLDPSSPVYRIGYDYDRCRAFLGAYQQVEPVPEDERAALPLVFRAQRLYKALNKCNNLLQKHAAAPQAPKDVRKLVGLLEEEVVRLHWLRLHTADLLAAFNS